MEDQNWFGPEMATFGDRLAAAREASGMTQSQMAKRLGVRATTLRGWEEDRSEPRANHLSIMAGILNVSLMWLINGEGEGLDAPDDQAAMPAELSDLLAEMRQLRTDLRAKADRIGRIEKKLRANIPGGLS